MKSIARLLISHVFISIFRLYLEKFLKGGKFLKC